MKKLTLMSIMFLICLQACSQTKELSLLTTEDWEEDIAYLNKKIQKEFQSFDPTLKSQFDKEITALKTKLPELENYEISGEIMRLMSMLKDGHTELNVGHKNVKFHRVPMSLYFFESELHILAIHEQHKDLIGGKVVGIGNFSIEQAFEKLKKNMSRDNKMEYLHAGPGYLILTELLAYLGITADPLQSTFTIELSDGSTVKRSFSGLNRDEYNSGSWVGLEELNKLEPSLYTSQRGKRYWHKYLSESKTMYFNFSRVNNQKGQPSIKKFINEMFDQIDELKPEKLVIDFRLNHGGNYNLSRPLIDGIKSRSWLNKKDKIWAISGRTTFSAASVACIFLKKETNATLIGEPGRTHPNQADNNEYMNLPNSDFLMEYTTKVKVHWPERPDLDHVPVDIEKIQSFKDYEQGIDPVLEYILKQ